MRSAEGVKEQGTTAGTHQSESRGVHAIMDLQQNE